MRLIPILFLVATMLFTSAITSVSATRHKRHSHRKKKTDSRIICYLFVPWPFNKCCGVDSDRDGVKNDNDLCPDTPPGAEVDSQGCPADSDGDGVFDGIDRCANTPSDLEVDEFGCPIEVTETETQFLDTGVISTSNITFEFGKADLKPESHEVLDEIGRILVQWPKLRIEIGGHTDSRGSEEYNRMLSEQRADAVCDYLISQFPKIKAKNFSTRGYGESVSIYSNDTEEGRGQNRRVEFKVLNKETLKREIERKGYKRK